MEEARRSTLKSVQMEKTKPPITGRNYASTRHSKDSLRGKKGSRKH